jgi:hypothetical protein
MSDADESSEPESWDSRASAQFTPLIVGTPEPSVIATANLGHMLSPEIPGIHRTGKKTCLRADLLTRLPPLSPSHSSLPVTSPSSSAQAPWARDTVPKRQVLHRWARRLRPTARALSTQGMDVEGEASEDMEEEEDAKHVKEKDGFTHAAVAIAGSVEAVCDCAWVWEWVWVYIHRHTHTHIILCIHTHINYIYIYTFTHTHTHTHTHTGEWQAGG